MKERKEPRRGISLGIKCGECLHFKVGPAVFEKKCSELGQQSFSKACPKFTPNHYMLINDDDTLLEKLAHISRKMSQKQLRLLAYTFSTISSLMKTGFRFGQPVFINVSAPQIDYVECYRAARVVGKSKDGKHIILTANIYDKQSTLDFLQKKKRGIPINQRSFLLPITSVLSQKDFEDKARELKKEKKVRVPESMRYHLPENIVRRTKKMDIKDKQEYVPTIEDAPDSWFKKEEIQIWDDPIKKKRRRKPKIRRTQQGTGIIDLSPEKT